MKISTYLFFVLVISSGVMALCIYPSLPPEMINHANPDVPTNMPRHAWLIMHLAISVFFIPGYFAMASKRYSFSNLLFRHHRTYYDGFFILVTLLMLCGVIEEILAQNQILMPERLSFGIFAFLFMSWCAIVTKQTWFVGLFQNIPNHLHEKWEKSVKLANKLFWANTAYFCVISFFNFDFALWSVFLIGACISYFLIRTLQYFRR